MSGQRARPSIPAEHRSAHPNIPGVPWWGAVVIAIVASAIGFAFDLGSGGGHLTGAFSTLYVLGCLAAVLAVRQAGVFTAVIQPPLILFVMVPGSYYLMHSSDIHGVKDILINCGYPLIERFPLMFFTSLTVLLVGAARWYLGTSSRQSQPAEDAARYPGSALVAKLASLLGSASASGAQREPRRRHSAERRSRDAQNTGADRGARAARGGRPVKRAGPPPRSRHARPPHGEFDDPLVDVDRPRPRRPRPDESMPPPDPRRRPRPASSQRDPRRGVPPGQRRASHDPAERRERPQPRRRYDDYGDYEPRDPHRPPGTGSHHPVSRVRYRGADDGGQPEYRTRGRSHRRDAADRWEYDI